MFNLSVCASSFDCPQGRRVNGATLRDPLRINRCRSARVRSAQRTGIRPAAGQGFARQRDQRGLLRSGENAFFQIHHVTAILSASEF
jgi:hypothetical protein